MSDIFIGPELESYSPEVMSNPQGEALAVRFDVTSLLEAQVGENWQEASCQAILGEGDLAVRNGEHYTVREANPQSQFGLITLEGGKLDAIVPGLWELYKGAFKQMMQAALPAGLEPLHSYEDPLFALEAVAHTFPDPSTGINYRYEAHVDQRYTGVLVLDAPSSGDQGGRLVISNKKDAKTVEDIEKDPLYIVHKPGTLVCFSKGRFYPHYTEELKDPEARRVTISLNYPVEGETPEAAQLILNHALGKYD